jgi:hypothetical protein
VYHIHEICNHLAVSCAAGIIKWCFILEIDGVQIDIAIINQPSHDVELAVIAGNKEHPSHFRTNLRVRVCVLLY